eukprot:1156673-Pelagomonas_calceolata.AAC.1
MALPMRPLSVHGALLSVPRYLHLNLGKRAEKHSTSTHLLVIGLTKEDFKMKSMLCSFVLALLCVLFEELITQLFSDFPSHRIFLDKSGAFFYSQASSED